MLAFSLLLCDTVQAQTNCSACFVATPDTSMPYTYNLDASCSTPNNGFLDYNWIIDGVSYPNWVFPFYQASFNTAGNHTIQLIVNDISNSCSDSSAVQTVNVTATCTASFFAYDAGNKLFQFYNAAVASNTAQVNYNFGDGNSSSTAGGAPVTHQYLSAGTYTVTCIITDTANGGCTDSSSQAIVVSNSNFLCAAYANYFPIGQNTFFIDASSSWYDPTNYSFIFSSGGTVLQSGTNATFTYTNGNPGLTPVDVSVADSNGVICSTTTLYLFNTNTATCYACFTYYPINLAGDSILFDASCAVIPPGGSLSWNVNGTSTFNGITLLTQMPVGTSYVSLLTLDSNGVACDSIFQSVYVQAPPCNSVLNITPVVGSTSKYIFSGSGAANPYFHSWSIDNDYFTTLTPTFEYEFKQSGTYNVCYTTYDITGTACVSTCSNVAVNTTLNTNYDVCGSVYEYTTLPNYWGYKGVDSGSTKVYLVTLAVGGQLDAVDSTIVDAGGFYCFKNKPIFDYRIKAAMLPSSATYADNIPTYYYSSMMWNQAAIVTLAGNKYGTDMLFIQGVNTGGPGIISGNVLQGANKPIRGNEPLDGLTVMAFDVNTNKPVAFAKTKIGGTYTFDNLPLGKYKIYGELLNRVSVPAVIEITGTNTDIKDINLEVNKNSIIPTTNMPTGINDVKSLTTDIKPNPANTQFELVCADGDATATITDAMGKVVATINLLNNKVTAVDCSTWNKGMYFVRIQNAKAQKVEKLIIR
jgi:hypothetical protein